MKTANKEVRDTKLILVLLIIIAFLFSFIAYKVYQDHEFKKLLDKRNERVYDLLDKGYEVQDARHMSAVENGIRPKDARYEALKKKEK
jgi:hypothetical protein